jgi:hypothetical protein
MKKTKSVDFYCDIEAVPRTVKYLRDNNILDYYFENDKTLLDDEIVTTTVVVAGVSGKIKITEKSFLRLCDLIIATYPAINVINCYFHSLQFDLSIIIEELRYNKFKHVVDMEKMKDKVVYIDYEHTRIRNNTIQIFGENINKATFAIINYEDRTFNLYDTNKVWTGSVKSLGETFNISTPKIDVEWDNNTVEFDKIKNEYVITEYVVLDIIDKYELIVQRCLNDCIILEKGYKKLVKMIESKYKSKGNTAASITINAVKYYLNELGEDFDILFPQINDKAYKTSTFSYVGGLVLSNIENKIVENIYGLDVTNSYVKSLTMPLPYGKPKETDKLVEGKYQEMLVYISFEIKENKLAWFRVHKHLDSCLIFDLEHNVKHYSSLYYPNKWEGYICINSIDLENLVIDYNILEFSVIHNFVYDTQTLLKDFWEKMFNDRLKAKENKDTALDATIKLFLVSGYGKFGQNLSNVKNKLYFTNGERYRVIDEKPYYKPVANAVTAYSRGILLEMFRCLYPNAAYGDTDSVYIVGLSYDEIMNKVGHLIDNNVLGKWNFDRDKETNEIINYDKGRFIAKKTYLLMKGDRMYVKMVGLSKNYHHLLNINKFDDLDNQKAIPIQKMRMIKGGKAMLVTSFRIRKRNYLGGFERKLKKELLK